MKLLILTILVNIFLGHFLNLILRLNVSILGLEREELFEEPFGNFSLMRKTANSVENLSDFV
jgi:hypothetical protein